ncbi:UNVERIFIED_CONTAM: hypothetical protein K2H54_053593 [Gekko kuhli]
MRREQDTKVALLLWHVQSRTVWMAFGEHLISSDINNFPVTCQCKNIVPISDSYVALWVSYPFKQGEDKSLRYVKENLQLYESVITNLTAQALPNQHMSRTTLLCKMRAFFSEQQ